MKNICDCGNEHLIKKPMYRRNASTFFKFKMVQGFVWQCLKCGKETKTFEENVNL